MVPHSCATGEESVGCVSLSAPRADPYTKILLPVFRVFQKSLTRIHHSSGIDRRIICNTLFLMTYEIKNQRK